MKINFNPSRLRFFEITKSYVRTIGAEKLRDIPSTKLKSPLSNTVSGYANPLGETIAVSTQIDSFPLDFNDFTNITPQQFRNAVEKFLPSEFKNFTSEEEKKIASNLIFSCHLNTLADPNSDMDDAGSKKFFVETRDKNGSLIVVHRDYPGAFERLLNELDARNYEVRFIRSFSFNRTDLSQKHRYTVSFIAPEGFARIQDEQAKKTNNPMIEEKKIEVVNELRNILSYSETEYANLVDKLFNELPFEILEKKTAYQLARRIKNIEEGIKEKLSVINFEKGKVRIGIKDRHVTKLLAEICGVIRKEGGDIHYLTVESLENDIKSIVTMQLLDAQSGKPINEAKFEEIKKSILDLTAVTLGKRSLIDNIIGPAMIPTSSSHTCGANRMARVIRNIIVAGFEAGYLSLDSKYSLTINMCNTFQLNETGSGKGHYSDEAVIAGLLDIPHDDEALKNAKKILREQNSNGKGIELEITDNKIGIDFTEDSFINTTDRSLHVNTIIFNLLEKKSDGTEINHVFNGESTGGSAIEILKIFDGDCGLQKKVGLEPIRGNIPTSLLLLNGNSSSRKIEGILKSFGYKIINSSSGKNKRLVICLDRKLGDKHLSEIRKETEKIADVKLINDPLFSFETHFSDFKTLVKEAIAQEKEISDLAIAYEMQLKNKKFDEIFEEMRQLLRTMLQSVEKGLNAKEPLFSDGENYKIEGNAGKLKIAREFPHDIKTFTRILNSIFTYEKQRGKQALYKRTGKKSPSSTNDDLEKWWFLITDPYIRTIFEKSGAETVL
jgi:L-serine deaminase